MPGFPSSAAAAAGDKQETLFVLRHPARSPTRLPKQYTNLLPLSAFIRTRRVKCDETRPACLRCVIGGRSCHWQDQTRKTDTERGHSQQQFKSIYFTNHTQAFALQEDAIMALEYFYTFTLPLFEVSEPNLLWRNLRRDAPCDETLCYIAAALGQEHMHLAREQVHDYSEKSCRLNGRCLRSMQRRLSTQSLAQTTTAALCSLLMAVLLGLHSRHADMLVHLRCGYSVAQQGVEAYGKEANPELNETLRLLKKYCVSSMLFDSMGIEADKTASILSSETVLVTDLSLGQEQNDHQLGAELELLVEELLHFMRLFRTTQHDSSGNIVAVHTQSFVRRCQNPVFETILSKLAAKQSILQVALDEKLSTKRGEGITSIVWEAALAQCLLAGIYVRCCCLYQNSLNDEMPTFRRILELEKVCLTSLRGNRQPLCAMPLSLGLGAIGCLVSLVQLCPNRQLRHEAIQMLDLCPSTEGLWSVETARRLCLATVEFEEQLMAVEKLHVLVDSDSQVIPRHCRISHHNFGTVLGHGVTKVRFFRAVGGMQPLAYDDVII